MRWRTLYEFVSPIQITLGLDLNAHHCNSEIAPFRLHGEF